jgi:hypothetical protein
VLNPRVMLMIALLNHAYNDAPEVMLTATLCHCRVVLTIALRRFDHGAMLVLSLTYKKFPCIKYIRIWWRHVSYVDKKDYKIVLKTQ